MSHRVEMVQHTGRQTYGEVAGVLADVVGKPADKMSARARWKAGRRSGFRKVKKVRGSGLRGRGLVARIMEMVRPEEWDRMSVERKRAFVAFHMAAVVVESTGSLGRLSEASRGMSEAMKEFGVAAGAAMEKMKKDRSGD